MKSWLYILKKIDKEFINKENKTNKIFKEKLKIFDIKKTLKDIEINIKENIKMLICPYCGDLINEEDLGSDIENRGEFWGSPCNVFIQEECKCGGNYEKAKKCELCEEYFYNECSYVEVCQKCLKKNCTLENAILFGAENEKEITINGFYSSVFTVNEINEILTKEYKQFIELMKDESKKEIKKYCLNDELDFSEFLVENEK